MSTELSFAELRFKNVGRKIRWHDPANEDWTGADWSNAMNGEAGEAANVVKKLRRCETGLWDAQHYPGDSTNSQLTSMDSITATEELRKKLAAELADTVIYADLLAHYYNIDLGHAVVTKFNKVSEAQGFPERLEAVL
jgi:NTP pyrophosphatase (non-canonical NTP hydrolase)